MSFLITALGSHSALSLPLSVLAVSRFKTEISCWTLHGQTEGTKKEGGRERRARAAGAGARRANNE